MPCGYWLGGRRGGPRRWCSNPLQAAGSRSIGVVFDDGSLRAYVHVYAKELIKSWPSGIRTKVLDDIPPVEFETLSSSSTVHLSLS
jgi:hypothetical protein